MQPSDIIKQELAVDLPGPIADLLDNLPQEVEEFMVLPTPAPIELNIWWSMGTVPLLRGWGGSWLALYYPRNGTEPLVVHRLIGDAEALVLPQCVLSEFEDPLSLDPDAEESDEDEPELHSPSFMAPDRPWHGELIGPETPASVAAGKSLTLAACSLWAESGSVSSEPPVSGATEETTVYQRYFVTDRDFYDGSRWSACAAELAKSGQEREAFQCLENLRVLDCRNWRADIPRHDHVITRKLCKRHLKLLDQMLELASHESSLEQNLIRLIRASFDSVI